MGETYRRALRRESRRQEKKLRRRSESFAQPVYGGTLSGKTLPPAIGSIYGGSPYAMEPPPSAVFYDESAFVQPVQESVAMRYQPGVVPAYPDLYEVLPDGTVRNRVY